MIKLPSLPWKSIIIVGLLILGGCFVYWIASAPLFVLLYGIVFIPLVCVKIYANYNKMSFREALGGLKLLLEVIYFLMAIGLIIYMLLKGKLPPIEIPIMAEITVKVISSFLEI